MIDGKGVLVALFWYVIAHTTVWFQLNGQFLWPWFRKNEWVVASAGAFISFFYIWGTKAGVGAFNGLLWPNRFIGFSVGILVYGLLVYQFMGEGINTKTAISLLLCLALILIQVLWK